MRKLPLFTAMALALLCQPGLAANNGMTWNGISCFEQFSYTPQDTLILLAQFGAIVSLVAEHPFRRPHSADQALRDRAIMRFASGQQDGEKAPFSICECVNLRVAPSARAANSLLLLPPFPPAAERCAFTCVESIICVSVARPFPASSRNRFSHTPRRAQRTKRL